MKELLLSAAILPRLFGDVDDTVDTCLQSPSSHVLQLDVNSKPPEIGNVDTTELALVFAGVAVTAFLTEAAFDLKRRSVNDAQQIVRWTAAGAAAAATISYLVSALAS